VRICFAPCRRIGLKRTAGHQLDFFVGAYAFASAVYVPPLLATLACAPLVFWAALR